MDEKAGSRRWENWRDADPQERLAVVNVQDAWGTQQVEREQYEGAIYRAEHRHEEFRGIVYSFALALVLIPATIALMTWLGPDCSAWWMLLIAPLLFTAMAAPFVGCIQISEYRKALQVTRSLPEYERAWEDAAAAQMYAEFGCDDDELFQAWALGPLRPQYWDMRMF